MYSTYAIEHPEIDKTQDAETTILQRETIEYLKVIVSKSKLPFVHLSNDELAVRWRRNVMGVYVSALARKAG